MITFVVFSALDNEMDVGTICKFHKQSVVADCL